MALLFINLNGNNYTMKNQLGKKIRGIALAAFTFAGGSNAMAEEAVPNIFPNDNAYHILHNVIGIYNDLQWDILRDRDRAGDNQCFDADNDGIADTTRLGHDMEALKKDNYRYELHVFTDRQREPQIFNNLTKFDALNFVGDASTVMVNKRATGLLIGHQGGSPFIASVIVIDGDQAKIARPSADIPVGNYGAGRKPCNTLEIPQGMK